MKNILFVFFAAAACSSASAEVILNIPSQIVPPSTSPTDLSLGLGFAVTAPDVSQDLLGYDLYLQVTGGSELSITGVGAGNDPLGSSPVFAVTADTAGDTLYYFGNFAFSGAATIANGTALLTVDAQLQAGATGAYQVAAFVNPSGSPTTQFFSGLDAGGDPIAVAGLSVQAGTIGVALPGDANLDGQVDVNDLTIVLANYNQTGMTWTQGEFTGDGTVDINDLTIVLAHYGQGLGSPVGSAAAVPEPSALLLIVVGIAALLAFARRRRTR
jgi:hypothetical protein